MNATKWRISKACEECREKKIRCNGESPCQSCRARSLSCVYREKARNRKRKPRTAAYENVMLHEAASAEPSEDGSAVMPSPSGDAAAEQPQAAAAAAAATTAAATAASTPALAAERSININSVGATHRASPSCLLQLYYGPSSNFALISSIYHQMEGTRPHSPTREGVEEVGPGLDRFTQKKLFFGDLADTPRSRCMPDDCSIMMIDLPTARRLLDRYLLTYWHGLPILGRTEYRRRLEALYMPPGIFDFDSPETISIMLAMALGASMLGEESIAEYLFKKSKQGASQLDEVVNMQVVQMHLLMIKRARPNSSFLHLGSAVRKAVATGLHKGFFLRPGQSQADADERWVTFWSLYFWETWTSFVVGRPSSIPDPGPSVALPSNQTFLMSLVTLSRIMTKCVKRIYSPRHDSLLPVWNAAMEIRRDLHQFAEKQSKDMKFGLVGDPSTGELGVRQAMVSTMYHHTLLLTFRPFLILRAKLKQDQASSSSGSSPAPHTPPPWLDTACEYCLDAARNSVGFLAGSCASNVLCHDINYHGFFLEAACHTLAFDMLQNKASAYRALPWIRSGLRCLGSMAQKTKGDGQIKITISTIEQMVRSVFPNMELSDQTATDSFRQSHGQSPSYISTPTSTANPQMSNGGGVSGASEPPAFTYPNLPFGFDLTGVNGVSPTGVMADEQTDFTAADIGWDIDFGTMDMEAFLSLDPAQNFAMERQ